MLHPLRVLDPFCLTDWWIPGFCSSLRIEAEKWVDGMSKAADCDTTELRLEARPSMLGLGAKVAPQIEVGPLNDAVERKLYSKLNAKKRKASFMAAENTRCDAETNNDSDSDEGEPSGRSQAFSKKKADPSNLFFLAKKK